MSLSTDALPFSTIYDPVEDPPSSIDPLGTLTHAERLAEILLPGFTARMWRPRLLTLATVNGVIVERVVKLLGGRQEAQLEARLAFERLLVSAVVRLELRNPDDFEGAGRRLPGNTLARKALMLDEPLTRNNFLKGQAVNGPFGVIARLARNVDVLDEEGCLGRLSQGLLAAWSEDQNLKGLQDEDGSDRPGAIWARDAARTVANWMGNKGWPGPGQRIWEQLASKLRPDDIGNRENHALASLLEGSDIRRRVLSLLSVASLVRAYREAQGRGARGNVERLILRAMNAELDGSRIDRKIATTISAIEAYETVAALFQQAFDALLWGLTQNGGRAEIDTILGDQRVWKHMSRTLEQLRKAIPSLEQSVERMKSEASLDNPSLIDPITGIIQEARLGSASIQLLVEEIMRRHERVQKQKRKGVWIERDQEWTLLPGFGIDGTEPPVRSRTYLHPFRIVNAYSFLSDLGHVSMKVADGED